MNYKGYEIKIIQDEFSKNPREEFDNLGTMVCFHRQYNLGDKHSYTVDKIKEKIKTCIALPLYLYDHSGITINTTGFSCRWDSGQIGYIILEKEKARKEYGILTKKRIEKILSYLKSEVKIYDNYLTGEIYGYEIETLEKSCWGFYGSDHEKSGLLEMAKNAIDCHINEKLKIEGEQMELNLIAA
jgi:hypothetical protein